MTIENYIVTNNRLKFVLLLLFFILVALLIQNLAGGFLADRGNHSDEAAHFVSSLAIDKYIVSGMSENPIVFGKNYYSHFPKVAIGHWPPFFEALQALVLLLFGETAIVAIVLMGLIASLCAAIAAFVVCKSWSLIEGIVAGALVLFSPILLPMINMDMADTLVALMVTLAALSWSKFYNLRNWKWALLFAFTAASAILTKGNAFGLAFMPLIYVAITRDFIFLFSRKTILSAALIAICTLPWYAFTYQMAADGFVYKWGAAYTYLAAPFFAKSLVAAVGIPCFLAYLLGVIVCMCSKKDRATYASFDITAFVSTSLAMLLFAIMAPADLDRRYLIPALPCIVIVSMWGIRRLVANIKELKKYETISIYITCCVFLFSLFTIFQLPHVMSFQTPPLVEKILDSGKANPLILISGSVPAEGAFIAALAERDRHETHYVLRAQKALAKSDWMGHDYKLKFLSPEEVADWINNSGIGWIVIDSYDGLPNFPHNELLKKAIDKGLLHVDLVSVSKHAGGEMSLYALPDVDSAAPISGDILALTSPGHLGALGK